MRPVVGIRRVAGRQTNNILFCVDAQTENSSVCVAEVSGHLVNLENLAVIEARLSHCLNIGLGHLIGGQCELACVIEASEFTCFKGVFRPARIRQDESEVQLNPAPRLVRRDRGPGRPTAPPPRRRSRDPRARRAGPSSSCSVDVQPWLAAARIAPARSRPRAVGPIRVRPRPGRQGSVRCRPRRWDRVGRLRPLRARLRFRIRFSADGSSFGRINPGRTMLRKGE